MDKVYIIMGRLENDTETLLIPVRHTEQAAINTVVAHRYSRIKGGRLTNVWYEEFVPKTQY